MSFKNTILILTSNMGSAAILEGAAGGSSEAVKDTVMSMVRLVMLKDSISCLERGMSALSND